MIPLRDENPSRGIPVVNVMLILINGFVFIYPHLFAPGLVDTVYLKLGFIPYEFFHLKDIGPQNLVPPPLTLITAMFLHGGWIHLLGNMLYLWIFGDNVEDVLGHGRYLFFYLLCGVTAALVHGFLHMNSRVPTIGASGAIAGVLGAYLFLFPGARIRTLFIIFIIIRVVRIPAVLLLGFWILIQTYSGLSEFGRTSGAGIAWFAHIGGFIAGFLLILMMKKKRMGYRRKLR